MIKRNEGMLDRAIRIITGLLVIIVSVAFLSGTSQVIGYVLAGVLLVTGVVGYCGLYSMLGISTCPVDTEIKKD